MEVNEECVSSFFSSLDEIMDFSQATIDSKLVSDENDQEVLEALYTLANQTIFGKISVHKTYYYEKFSIQISGKQERAQDS